MAEDIKPTLTAPIDIKPVETAPVQTTTLDTNPTTAVEPTGDILTRVSKKKEVKPEDIAGTFKMFDDITDPAQRQKLIDREKERTADYTRKMQEISREREDLQSKLKDMENWTPEKVQNYLLKNPTFLQAAQQVASAQNPAGSGLTDEQFSALTPGEKNQLSDMNRQLGELRQQNFLSAMSQRDSLLQAKYGDYESLKVNQAFNDLARLNPLDLKEHIYKSIYHDQHVKDAYEEGKKDASTLNQTRAQASTLPGFSAQPASQVSPRNPKESDTAYFVRLAQARIEQRKGMQAAVK